MRFFEGQTVPGGIDGKFVDAVLPLPVKKVSASIGGQAAVVTYAGGAPGMPAGVMQVNVQVPEGLAAGDLISIILDIGGNLSQPEITLAVR